MAGHGARVERRAKTGDLVVHRRISEVLIGDGTSSGHLPLSSETGLCGPSGGWGVRLVSRVDLAERQMGGGQVGDPANLWPGVQHYAEAFDGVELRNQVDVGQARSVVETPALVADRLLDGGETLADPVADPLSGLLLVVSPLAQQVEHASVVQRADIVTDQRHDSVFVGAMQRIAGEQGRVRVTLLEVLGNRRRLD